MDSTLDVTIRRMQLKIMGLAPTDPGITAALNRIGMILRARVIGNIRKNDANPTRFPKGNKNNLIGPKKTGGKLLNSVRYEVRSLKNGSAKATLSVVGLPYAIFHERGGRISPKKSKIGLMVPYTEWARGRKPSSFGRFFIVHKQAGKKFLGFAFIKSKMKNSPYKDPFQAGAVSHLFLKYVDIPKRPFFYPAIAASQTDIVDILRNIRRENGNKV